ncbi:MAG: hypothetical protein B7X06_04580 [Verrucomicrobia bacterium 21-51-4]|nr:MAG: hypothetical protein B7X06_04580 [Verrucomicrobia bacterium 21-51-4]
MDHWVKLYELSGELAARFVFVAGPSAREQAILEAVCQKIPRARSIPKIADLRHLMALIAQARLVVVGDTGPIHLAAGLGVPYVGFYGPSPVELWHPHGVGKVLIAPNCPCYGHPRSCIRQQHCLAAIRPEQVLSAMHNYL